MIPWRWRAHVARWYHHLVADYLSRSLAWELRGLGLLQEAREAERRATVHRARASILGMTLRTDSMVEPFRRLAQVARRAARSMDGIMEGEPLALDSTGRLRPVRDPTLVAMAREAREEVYHQHRVGVALEEARDGGRTSVELDP